MAIKLYKDIYWSKLLWLVAVVGIVCYELYRLDQRVEERQKDRVLKEISDRNMAMIQAMWNKDTSVISAFRDSVVKHTDAIK